MKRLAIIVILFSILSASFGCAIPKLSETPSLGDVAHLKIYCPPAKNYDADPEADGLGVEMQPYDINYDPINAEGVVSVKLWLEGEKDELLQEWYGIHIGRDDYRVFGAILRLEYVDYVPEVGDYGILEVTFTTPDQKSFTARHTYVVLY